MEKRNHRGLLGAVFAVLAALCLSALLVGCLSTDNNERTLGEVLDHMTEKGIKITEVGVLNPEAAHAEAGLTAKIEGREIGLYRFDLKRRKQRERIEKAVEKGFIGIAGHKFESDDFAVNGSFVLIDYKANPKGEEILKAFKSF